MLRYGAFRNVTYLSSALRSMSPNPCRRLLLRLRLPIPVVVVIQQKPATGDLFEPLTRRPVAAIIVRRQEDRQRFGHILV